MLTIKLTYFKTRSPDERFYQISVDSGWTNALYKRKYLIFYLPSNIKKSDI